MKIEFLGYHYLICVRVGKFHIELLRPFFWIWFACIENCGGDKFWSIGCFHICRFKRIKGYALFSEDELP